MHVLVLNGSPRGEYSVTLQTVRYWEKRYPQHTFEVLHVGARIKAFDKDFTPALEALERAEVILFSYPVYTFIAPSQLHRFIQLMKQHKDAVAGKWCTQISTSKHFYDVTAHNYIEENCRDMGLRYVRGLSADMDDLPTGKGRAEAEAFWEHFCWCVEQGISEPAFVQPAVYEPVDPTVPAPVEKKGGNVVIVADLPAGDSRLSAMLERFRAVLPLNTRVVSLPEYPFKGGCLGCFNCAVDGKCIYTDGFDKFLREEIQTADAIIYAFYIKDHSMGPLFKMYDDRQFCNGHRTVTVGMPVGYLISGCYSAERNLQAIVEGRAQVGGNTLVGIATDETDPDGQVDRMAAALVYALEHRYTQPRNFYGVGGMKIFRDLIYQMRGMMRADHKFYKAHGEYDFPQKKWPQSLLMYLVGAMLASPKIKAKMGNKMNEGMVMAHRKVVEQAQPKAK